MMILRKKNVITDLKIIYVGLKKGWLTPEQVMSLYEKGVIVLSDEILLEIYSLSIESGEQFVHIFEKKYAQIVLDEIDIKKGYYLFWAVEFLLQIVEENIDKILKLEKISLLYMDFNYPCEWNDFIYYMPSQKGKSLGIDVLYSNVLRYIDDSIEKIKEDNNI